MHRPIFFCAFALLFVSPCVSASADEYHITAAEQAACRPDAERLCLADYPNEDRMIGCMKANRQALSPRCAEVLKAGLKRRGIR